MKNVGGLDEEAAGPPSWALMGMMAPGHRETEADSVRNLSKETDPQEPSSQPGRQWMPDPGESQHYKCSRRQPHSLTGRLCEGARKSPLSRHWEASEGFLSCLTLTFRTGDHAILLRDLTCERSAHTRPCGCSLRGRAAGHCLSCVTMAHAGQR